MDRVIGGIFGMAAFLTVVVVSISKDVPFGACILRAFVAMILGYFVGRYVFGLPGLSLVREAAGPLPPRAAPPSESKPTGTPPGAGAPPKASA